MGRLGWVLGTIALAVLAFALGTNCARRDGGGSPGARVRAALAEPDPVARAMALVPILLDLEPRHVGEVEEAYRAAFAGGGPGDSAITLLCEAWGALDPVGALDRTARWPAKERIAAQKALLRAWARRNPAAALQWSQGVRDGGTALEAVLTGWAESGDPKLWDYVAAMPPNIAQQSALIELMQEVVVRGGFDALFARVEELPEDGPSGFKRMAMGTATALVADHDPARALAFADRHADTPNGTGLLRRIAVRWVKRDAPAAMQYVLDRSPSADRDWALREAYRVWLRRDRRAALAWMPASASALDARLTLLADIYAVALANGDPKHPVDSVRGAIRWSEEIPDAAKRHETLVQLGVIWLYYEPERASDWLAQNGLDAEVRAEAERYEKIRRRFSAGAS